MAVVSTREYSSCPMDPLATPTRASTKENSPT